MVRDRSLYKAKYVQSNVRELSERDGAYSTGFQAGCPLDSSTPLPIALIETGAAGEIRRTGESALTTDNGSGSNCPHAAAAIDSAESPAVISPRVPWPRLVYSPGKTSPTSGIAPGTDPL